MVNRNRLNVSCSGGAHQFAHYLPVAFALASTMTVELFVNDQDDAGAANEMARNFGQNTTLVTVMRLPRVLEWIVGGGAGARLAKGLRLLWWSRQLRQGQGLLAAERTTTLLCWLPGRKPMMIHIPHGAGDRAKGFEKRIELFDALLVAGDKDRDRLVKLGRVAAERCHVTGSIKLAALRRLAPKRVPLFPNNRPVILYSPHFDTQLSSWNVLPRRLIDAVLADGRYNLIVAPHVRLFADRTPGEAAQWASASIPGRIFVDTGSARSSDMTYTEGADIYLGDVSSQVYEFIARPRPCLFVDAHGAAWRDNPDYAMWGFGPVVPASCDLIEAVDSAVASHGQYVGVQQTAARAALGPDAVTGGRDAQGLDAIDRAAAQIVSLLATP